EEDRFGGQIEAPRRGAAKIVRIRKIPYKRITLIVPLSFLDEFRRPCFYCHLGEPLAREPTGHQTTYFRRAEGYGSLCMQHSSEFVEVVECFPIDDCVVAGVVDQVIDANDQDGVFCRPLNTTSSSSCLDVLRDRLELEHGL